MKSLIVIAICCVGFLWCIDITPSTEDYYAGTLISIGVIWVIWKGIVCSMKFLENRNEAHEVKVERERMTLHHTTKSHWEDMVRWRTEFQELLTDGQIKQNGTTEKSLQIFQKADGLWRAFKDNDEQLHTAMGSSYTGYISRRKRYKNVCRSYNKLLSTSRSIETLHKNYSLKAEPLTRQFRKMKSDQYDAEKEQREQIRLEQVREQREAELERERVINEREKDRLEAEHLKSIEIAKIRAQQEKERDLEIHQEQRATDLLLKEKELATTKMLLEIERLKASKTQADKDRFDRLKSLLDD